MSTKSALRAAGRGAAAAICASRWRDVANEVEVELVVERQLRPRQLTDRVFAQPGSWRPPSRAARPSRRGWTGAEGSAQQSSCACVCLVPASALGEGNDLRQCTIARQPLRPLRPLRCPVLRLLFLLDTAQVKHGGSLAALQSITSGFNTDLAQSRKGLGQSDPERNRVLRPALCLRRPGLGLITRLQFAPQLGCRSVPGNSILHVGGDCGCHRVHETLSEEALQQRRKTGSWLHRRVSRHYRRRRDRHRV
jgi:hypothetical protein